MIRRRFRKHWLLLVIPYVWGVFLIPWANGVKTQPFGMPFLEVWMLLGVVVASICVGIVFIIDKRIRREEQ